MPKTDRLVTLYVPCFDGRGVNLFRLFFISTEYLFNSFEVIFVSLTVKPELLPQ